MTTALVYEETLTVHHCPSCAVAFAMPDRLETERRQDHGTFWCPNGHTLSYPQKTAIEKEKERRQRAEEETARVRAALDQELSAHRSTKGQLTKAKKRVAGGACPCCNRTFVQLTRHMATKHPDYAQEAK